MSESQETVACPACSTLILVNWKYCPSCGTHINDETTTPSIKKKGRLWCPFCKKYRNVFLHVWDSKEVHTINPIFCHVCGHKLEGSNPIFPYNEVVPRVLVYIYDVKQDRNEGNREKGTYLGKAFSLKDLKQIVDPRKKYCGFFTGHLEALQGFTHALRYLGTK